MDYFGFLKRVIGFVFQYIEIFTDHALFSFGFPIIKLFFGVVIVLSLLNFIFNHLSIYSPIIKEVYEERKEGTKKGG